MRIALFAAIALTTSLLASTASAQCTGFPGINDYTINGSTSGATSCSLVTIPTSSPITVSVSSIPSTPVAILLGTSVPGSSCTCQGRVLSAAAQHVLWAAVAGLPDVLAVVCSHGRHRRDGCRRDLLRGGRVVPVRAHVRDPGRSSQPGMHALEGMEPGIRRHLSVRSIESRLLALFGTFCLPLLISTAIAQESAGEQRPRSE